MEHSCSNKSNIAPDYLPWTYSIENDIYLTAGIHVTQNNTIISGKATAVTEPGVVKHVHCLPCCLIILLRVSVVIVFLSSNRSHSNYNKTRFHHLGK